MEQQQHKDTPVNLLGHTFSSFERTLTPDDFILYALSLNLRSLPFTYESHPLFRPFPTFSAPLGLRDFPAFTELPVVKKHGGADHILHGEEQTEVVRELEPGKRYRVVSKVADVQDKGKMTVFVKEKTVEDMNGQIYSKMISRLVLLGLGGFGHKSRMPSNLPSKPDRAPDFIQEEQTRED